jgi:hypothetical protein
MPTLYFDCPQCERPLAADRAFDGPIILCPCCDRRIDVPEPRVGNAPVAVWAAAVVLVLTPILAGLAPLIEPGVADAVPWGLAAAAVMLVPAVGLVRGSRIAWYAVEVLALAVGALGALTLMFGLAIVIMLVVVGGGSGLAFVLTGFPAFLGATAVAVLLSTPRCRDWCDR